MPAAVSPPPPHFPLSLKLLPTSGAASSERERSLGKAMMESEPDFSMGPRTPAAATHAPPWSVRKCTPPDSVSRAEIHPCIRSGESAGCSSTRAPRVRSPGNESSFVTSPLAPLTLPGPDFGATDFSLFDEASEVASPPVSFAFGYQCQTLRGCACTSTCLCEGALLRRISSSIHSSSSTKQVIPNMWRHSG